MVATLHYATPSLREAVAKLRVHGVRNAELARRSGITHPSILSNILAGSRPVRRDDPRVNKLLGLVGIEFETAFEDAEAIQSRPFMRTVA